jgi:hypothetical protein
MIKVSYFVREDDRTGYMEQREKRFDDMSEVFDFIKRTGMHRRIEGRIIIGTPVVEDDHQR